ncbi:MAG: FAD binding domain-containing protein [Bdellovibrionota bacterium]|nr:FAD binding domain-containing protein [Bdellovibrionota bacterium]
MRDTIVFYINGTRHEIGNKDAFKSLSDYLRYDLGKTGTKVVCAEGDCGACTVLVSSGRDMEKGKLYYRSLNSCITFLHLMDLHSIITVEGIAEGSKLHPIQSAMREKQGAQCGYCTPGFICAMAGMTDDLKKKKKPITEKCTKNYLTGNLCRCTGYDPIITAALSTDLEKVSPLYERYHSQSMIDEFSDLKNKSVKIKKDNYEVFLPSQIEEALELLEEGEIRITSGATDLGVQVNKGRHEMVKVLSLYRIQEMEKLEKINNEFHVGATSTWTDIEKAFENDIPEYSKLLRIFASPQIKNTGTLVGNIANASPIADGTPFLMVCGASVVLISKKGERKVPLTKFYKGYKDLDLEKGEIIKKVIIPIPPKEDLLKLYKVSLRKDLDISAVTFACQTQIKENKITNIKLAYGGVGPVVKRLEETENFLEGKPWNEETIKEGMKLVENEITPISDIRGSAKFRTQVSKNLLLKFFNESQR